MTAAARRFWQARTPRERVLMALLAAVLAAAALVLGAWRPLAAERDALRAEIGRHAAAERHLVLGGTLAPAGTDLSAQDDGQPLPARLTRSAQDFGLSVRRLDPAGDGGVEVTLDEAPFGSVLAWLADLEAARGLTLRAVRLQRRPAPGVVAASVAVGD